MRKNPHRCRANDGDTFLMGNMDHVTSQILWNPLGDDGDGSDLKKVT